MAFCSMCDAPYNNPLRINIQAILTNRRTDLSYQTERCAITTREHGTIGTPGRKGIISLFSTDTVNHRYASLIVTMKVLQASG